jgi:hypothetical protein
MKKNTYQGMYIEPRKAANGLIRYRVVTGRIGGQKINTGCFTYAKPKDRLQKIHNEDTKRILETKLAQMILQKEASGTGIVPTFKLEKNFMDYCQAFIDQNKRKASRA